MLAKTVCQPLKYRLIYRFREQARPHMVIYAKRLTRGAELAFLVREHDFHPTVLRPAPLGGVGFDGILVAIAFDLDAFFVDPQVYQHIRH